MNRSEHKAKIIESRYKVIKRIGRTNYAITYKVRDIRTSSLYVIKIYDKISIEQFYKIFDPESMEKAVSLHYKQITRIQDFGVHGNSIFFVREIFSENSLDKLKFDNLTLTQFYSIIGQMLDAIVFLDSQNFNASNLKLSNFLYKKTNKSYVVKLTDYFYIGPENRHKVYDTSFFYRAPETLSEGIINILSNFYSLGIMLYKITTGVFPYSKSDINSFLEYKNLKVVKSPSELNPAIPEELSNFILKLIKLNSEDRFLSIDEIINTLNRIQGKDFSYISNMKLKDYVIHHDYYVNEDISHLLVNHINKITKHDVDNIIVLHGQKGIRKDRTISLFRYHILNEKNLIFDYKCSKEENDPFFSLCQEFFHSGLIDKNEWEKAEPEISERFRAFISAENNQIADYIEADKIKADFLYVTKFMFFVAKKERPLIFVIRNAEYLQELTLKYLNFLISYEDGEKRFTTMPIMIVISTNNVNKMLTLNESSTTFIHSKAMDYYKSEEYTKRLLKNSSPSENIFTKIWYYSHGNPLYIKLIVLDLINKKYIYEENETILYKNITHYKPPRQILKFLELRLNLLGKEYLDYLSKISWLGIKFHKSYIYQLIPEIDKNFIDIALMNEFLEQNSNDKFTVIPEFIHSILDNKLSKKEKSKLSLKFLDFIIKNKISVTFEVIQAHLPYVEDFNLKDNLLNYFANRIIQNKSFILYFKTKFLLLKEAFKTKQTESYLKKLMAELILNLEYIYIPELLNEVSDFFKSVRKFTFYKNIVFGLCYFKKSEMIKALNSYLKAYEKIETPEERVIAELMIFNIHLDMDISDKLIKNPQTKNILNFNALKKGFISKIKNNYNYFHLRMIKKRALLHMDKGKEENARELIEKTISKIHPTNHLELFVFMDFYNILGNVLSNKKKMKSAIENYKKALKIATDYKIFYKIILINNNLADAYLVMGDPESAIPFIRGISNLCPKDMCINVHIQTLVNLSEAYIKMGEFDYALLSLNNAAELSKNTENKPFWNNILQNMALIKVKINNFRTYLDFLKENYPNLLEGKLKEITPTEKTYFYFLNQIGDYKTIKKILDSNKKLFENEQEFYFRVKSFLIFNELKKKRINKIQRDEALFVLKKTVEFSKNIKSTYAETISLINMAEYYLLLGELDKAKETLEKAENNCDRYKYKYWSYQAKIINILIKLQEPDIDLRRIIYELASINNYFEEKNIYYGEIFSLYILINIAHFMKRKKTAKTYFDKYRAKIIEATTSLDIELKNIFEKKFPLDYDTLIRNSSIKITPRPKKDLEEFAFEIFTLLNNKNTQNRCEKLVEILKDYIYFEHLLILKIDNEQRISTHISYNSDNEIKENSKFLKKVLLSHNKNKMVLYDDDKYHYCVLPISVKYDKFGVMVFYEDKNLPDLKTSELHKLNIIRLYLSSFFKFSDRISRINSREKFVKKMLDTFNEVVTSTDIKSMENKVLQNMSEILGAERAFLFKDGKETSHYIAEVDDESKEHTNIKLFYIEKESKKETLSFEYYYDAESRNIGNSIFIMNLVFDEFNYKAVYYFDNYESKNNLIRLDRKFLSMYINLIRTAMAVVHKNILSFKLKKEIENFREEKVFFLKLLSHEFNTPLTKIQYALEEIKNDVHNKNIDILYQSFNRISYLMEMVNKYYKYKEHYEPYYDYYDIKSVIRSTIDDIKRKSEEAGRKLTFSVEFSDNLPDELKFDKNAVIDILKILLSNSVRFSADGKKIIVGARMALFEKEQITKDTLVIYVTDFGKGIDKSESEKIYNVIYEAKNINMHKSGDLAYDSGGLGLGLSIASLILKKLNGKIEHESKKNYKTTFFVRIPID